MEDENEGNVMLLMITVPRGQKRLGWERGILHIHLSCQQAVTDQNDSDNRRGGMGLFLGIRLAVLSI